MTRPFGYGCTPSGWVDTRLRAVVSRRRESGRPDLPLLSVNLPDGVVLRRDGDGRPAPAEDLSGYQVVHPGDVVMNQLGKPHGAIGASPHFGIISPAYFVARVAPTAEPRFLHYLLRTRLYISEYERRGKFMPPSQFDISWDQFRSIEVTLPPLDEQRAIADFLDTETARIDALITKKRRLVELLDERVNAEISAFVGGSPLVDRTELSVAPIRRVMRKVERWTSEGEMITAFRDGEVTTRAERGREGFTNSWTDGGRVQIVETGDVVVHGLDGFSGAIGDSQRRGVCSPVYHVCEALDGDGAFLGRLLRLLALGGYLGNFAVSTRERAVDFRNWDLFGRIPVPVVPASDQRRLGDQIRTLRPLRAKVRQSELLANEHRHALITAAVTGHLDVSEVAV